jgi:hypothetical protein
MVVIEAPAEEEPELSSEIVIGKDWPSEILRKEVSLRKN